MLTWETLVLLLVTAAGALLLFSHFMLVWNTLVSPRLPPWSRVLALIPPLTPILAWLAGARLRVLLWAALLALYCALFVLTY